MTSYPSHSHETVSRMLQLTDEINAWIDPDFDTVLDDLEREFAELRLCTIKL